MNLCDAILHADARIRPMVRETWLETSPAFAPVTGGEVLLKLENLQHTGSFKLRGAANKILGLGPSIDRTRVVTASSGNHGAAVAYALRGTGGKALIFAPEGASPAKIANIRNLGAEIEFYGNDSAVTEAHARAYAEQNGCLYVPPYNDAAVIAGQGTVAVEMLRQAGHLDTVFVAVGGGGLISGVAAYLKKASPQTRIVGCSPINSCVMARSVTAGEVLDLPSEETLSDGTAGGIEPDTVTFPLCRDLVDHWIDVSEAEIVRAMRLFIDAHHMLLEGAAGVALAALGKAEPQWTYGRSAVIICGANISRERLGSVL